MVFPLILPVEVVKINGLGKAGLILKDNGLVPPLAVIGVLE